MDGAAALVLMLATLTVLLVGVESEQRVCYFGPPPEPDPDHPEDWMKQVMQEIRKRCPGRGQPVPIESSYPEALGMEDRTIPDERINASSRFAPTCCFAREARLNNLDKKRWTADTRDSNPWIEVDLTYLTVVSGIVTQGVTFICDGCRTQYVTKYIVSYRKQLASDYANVTDQNGDIKVFTGNTDGDTPVTNLFDESLMATVVRIEPTEWVALCSLRIELLGRRRG